MGQSRAPRTYDYSEGCEVELDGSPRSEAGPVGVHGGTRNGGEGDGAGPGPDPDDDVLIVDDTPGTLELLRRTLEAAGLVVRTAQTGAETVASAREHPPALILMDVILPDADGFEACRQLKADDRTRSVPVLFLSALEDEASRVKGFAAGGLDYISKPFHREEMFARIRTHLELRRANREMERRNVDLERAREALEAELRARKQVAEALRKSEEKFFRAFRSSPVIMAVASLQDNRFLEVNETFVRQTGYSREEAVGHTAGDLEFWADPGWMGELRRRLVDGRPVHDEEVCYRARGGDPRTCLFSAERIDIEGGPCALAVLVDITDRKRVEAELRESEGKMRAVWDHVNVGIVVVDAAKRVLAVNHQVREWYPDPDEQARSFCREKLLSKAPDGEGWACPTSMTLSDGRVHEAVVERPGPGGTRSFRIVSSPLLDGQGNVKAAVEVVEDVTEQRQAESRRRRIEERLVHLQRLESVGTLAGGVAHEINNPLNVILNCADLIQVEVAPGSDAAGFSREIAVHGERIAGIVRNLLAFAQEERRPRRPTPIAGIVGPAVDLVRAGLEHDGARILVDLPEDLPRVICHRQQIQQVLVNLLTNARDALNERYPGSDEDKIVRIVSAHRPGEGQGVLRISVENHGAEIPPAVRRRLFEPFFTTKPRGVGTGLGLSISHGIITEHHGTLTVDCEPGGWTRFHVDLPVDGGVGMHRDEATAGTEEG